MIERLGRPHEYAVPGAFPEPRDDAPDVPKRLLATVAAINEVTDEYGVREAARRAAISHSTLSRTVTGEIWPSSVTVASLETAFGIELWR